MGRQELGDLSPGCGDRPLVIPARDRDFTSISPDQLRGIQGVCERDQGSHPGSTAIYHVSPLGETYGDTRNSTNNRERFVARADESRLRFIELESAVGAERQSLHMTPRLIDTRAGQDSGRDSVRPIWTLYGR